jgi:hypothetical protein
LVTRWVLKSAKYRCGGYGASLWICLQQTRGYWKPDYKQVGKEVGCYWKLDYKQVGKLTRSKRVLKNS